jgi:hypothetical protein
MIPEGYRGVAPFDAIPLLPGPRLYPDKKEGPRHPGSGPVLVARTVNLYAISGILFTDRSADMCFFNHTLALHRPTNGAAAIIPNEIPNAICIQLLLSPRGLD